MKVSIQNVVVVENSEIIGQPSICFFTVPKENVHDCSVVDRSRTRLDASWTEWSVANDSLRQRSLQPLYDLPE